MRLQASSDNKDGYHWTCSQVGCCKTKSVRTGSCFEKSNLDKDDVLSIIYCWSVGMFMRRAATVLGLCNLTIIDWYTFLREDCSGKVLRMPIADKKLGGVCQIVEINESRPCWEQNVRTAMNRTPCVFMVCDVLFAMKYLILSLAIDYILV